MSYPQVNQASFFSAVHHIDRRTENPLGGQGELPAIVSHAQGVGADHPDALGIDTGEHLRKTCQTVEAACDGVRGQPSIDQPRPQLDFLCQCLDRAHFAVFNAGDDKVKRVTAQINGCQQAAVGERRLCRLRQNDDVPCSCLEASMIADAPCWRTENGLIR